MSNENKIKILVVDDSDIIRFSLKNFFSDYNFEVITCTDGLEGIQKAQEHKPSIIFLDLMMPNLDGVKMLQVIKMIEEVKRIPVIVISGNTNRTNVLASIEAGADRVMSKPLQKEIIIKNVTELLGPGFLQKAKKAKTFSNSETDEIRKKLVGLFLKSYPVKKEAILEALERNDKDALRFIVHEFKGAGGSIGYPQLTVISGIVEDQLGGTIINWEQMKNMCSQIFKIVSEIEESISEIEK